MINQLPLPPDDPRVNSELHLLVQKALQKVAMEERENFNPMKRPAQLVKVRLQEAREKVIADYQAEKASEAQT